MSGCCGTPSGGQWRWLGLVALAVGLALLLGLLGCAPSTIRVEAVSPRPVIDRTPNMANLGLEIEATPDTVRVAGASHLELVSVHTALRRGFMVAFGESSSASQRMLVVSLERVDLVSASAARAAQARGFDGASIVLVHGGHSPPTFSGPKVRVVRIHFRAALREGTAVIGQMSGRAHGSSFSSLDEESATASVTAAIEDVYVQVAERLFARAMATLQAPTGAVR